MESCSELTIREIQVLKLLCFGHSNKQVGAILDISIKTIEKHRAHLHRKIGIPLYECTGGTILIPILRYALKHQIIPYEVWVNANVTGHAVLALP